MCSTINGYDFISEMTSADQQLGSFERAIQDLYDFRDSYFINFTDDLYKNKDKEVENRIQELLKQFEQCGDITEDKATFFYLKGWLLNIRNEYSKEVFDLLAKSIKLRPNYSQAWIELGESYFKKDDLKLALNCFETVLKQDALNKKALRNASIILRSLAKNSEEKRANVLKSIEYAKKAVESDLNDGDSWAVLANAYLTLLFMSNRQEQPSLIKNCKSAYQKALIDRKVATKADILYNYASILQYEEEYDEALNCLAKAFKYDSEWRELEQRKNYLITFLNDIVKLADVSSILKAKRLDSIMDKLKSEEDQLRSRYATNQEMCGGNVKQVHQLSPNGVNDCLLLGRVVSCVSDAHGISLCSVLNMIDSTGKSIALFIYDIAHNKGPRSGDLILVLRPLLKSHRFQFEGKEYAFDAIKIVNPLQDLIVNHRPLSIDSLSVPVVNVTLKSD